jgi:hypothetical protein
LIAECFHFPDDVDYKSLPNDYLFSGGLLVEELKRCGVEKKIGAKHRFLLNLIQFGVIVLPLLSFGNLQGKFPD